MRLSKYLKDQSYDLIEGPVRNHKNLQIWLKKEFNEAELSYAQIYHAFKSSVTLNQIENPALSVNSSQKDEYAFNIGITILEEILKSLNMGDLEISAKIKSGKEVIISYDNSVTYEVPIGEIVNYLTTADFTHPNEWFLKNLNRENFLITTGVVFAKNLNVEIKTEFDVDAELLAKLNNIADGRITFTSGTQRSLKMVSAGSTSFPIAVKASRIHFQKGKFTDLKVITDTRDIF